MDGIFTQGMTTQILTTKILLVQTGFLGDVVLSTPLISELHAIYPQCELWLMTTTQAADLIHRDPLVAGIITYDKSNNERGFFGLLRKAAEIRAHNFDVVYSLHKSYRTSLLLLFSGIKQRIGFKRAGFSFLYTQRVIRAEGVHSVESNLSLLAERQSQSKQLRLFPVVSSQLSEPLRARIQQPGYVVLVPGSVWSTKRWHWQHYRTIAEQLVQQGNEVVILGSQAELQICNQVAEGLAVTNLAARTTLGEMTAVIAAAGLVICNDSLALHIASAMKIPTVAIFCATAPSFGFGPWQNKAIVVEKQGLSCKPCARHGGMTCPTGTNACMRELTPDTVYSAAVSLLKKV